ncbi:MAG: 4-alpha-glucanotransferase [Proteobacteria bacterium]|nr:4-alpha-glucanotransferase [Pseudomonadota bacterium]
MSADLPFDRRRAGLLLHPTSLPGGHDNGDLGPDAYRLVEFMAACGFTVWQTLPLGPTQDDLSPYSAQSVHAGNPRLIALEPLIKVGWLRPDGGPGAGETGWAYRQRRLIPSADRAGAADQGRLVEARSGARGGRGGLGLSSAAVDRGPGRIPGAGWDGARRLRGVSAPAPALVGRL